MIMRIEHAVLSSPDGTRLVADVYQPGATVRGGVVLVHGFSATRRLDAVVFVESEIAVLKEYMFDMLVTPENGTQNVHVLTHWKYQLRDELGFNVNYKPRMGTFEQDKFGGHHGNALDAFYTKFTPNYVIGKLVEQINEEKKRPGMEAGLVALCAKMLLGNNTDDIEYTKRMFECENDEVAENLMFKKITEEGVGEVLLKMGILEKAVS